MILYNGYLMFLNVFSLCNVEVLVRKMDGGGGRVRDYSHLRFPGTLLLYHVVNFINND